MRSIRAIRRNWLPLARFRVFVYGTLMPGGYYYREIAEGRLQWAITAKVRGRLHHHPEGYPALLAGDRWVEGVILGFEAEDLLRDMDALEGYEPRRAPEENLYERVEVEAFSLEGRAFGEVYTYLMTAQRARREGTRQLEAQRWDPAREGGLT